MINIDEVLERLEERILPTSSTKRSIASDCFCREHQHGTYECNQHKLHLDATFYAKKDRFERETQRSCLTVGFLECKNDSVKP